VQFAVVERILEKHSSNALMLCERRLHIAALHPRPDARPLLSREIDDHRLVFDNLPVSVSTDSFKKYLQRASPSQDDDAEFDRESAITDVIYGVHHGTALAVFQQPYGKQVCTLLAASVPKKCFFVLCELERATHGNSHWSCGSHEIPVAVGMYKPFTWEWE